MTGVDPYVYPGTNVLRNKHGMRDPAALRAFEYERSAVRSVQIRKQPLPERFDLAHLKKLHKHLFQDVYEWAGEAREIDIAKGGVLFALPQYIESEAKRISADLARENNLRGLDKAQFVERLAHHFGDWNALHPFREGNGRATREFLGQIARGAGWDIDQTRIDNNKQQWNNASRDSNNGHMKPMEEILNYAVRPTRAIAFEQLSEQKAIKAHPELKGVFETIKNMDATVKAGYPGQPSLHEATMQQVRVDVLKRLDAGLVVQAPALTQPPPERGPKR